MDLLLHSNIASFFQLMFTFSSSLATFRIFMSTQIDINEKSMRIKNAL